MTLLLWSIATSRVILTLDAARVISRRGEKVVPLRHKALRRAASSGRERRPADHEGRVQRGAGSRDILRWVGLPGRMISNLAGVSLPRPNVRVGSYAAIRGRHTLVRSCLKSRRLLAQSAAARCNVLCPSYVNPFHSLLPPTTRRSIVLIRSERSASAARISAIVCCNVLTFDPSDTIPPSTTAIDPITAT